MDTGSDLTVQSAVEVRREIRAGRVTGSTASLAPRMVQGNVVIVPSAHSEEFLRFCLANPKPCPLLAMGEPGDPSLPTLGQDIDIRTDVPRYRVFRDGCLDGEVTNLTDLWRKDLVSFILGCSFSFDWALRSAGLELRHVSLGRNVPMYRTGLSVVPAGAFCSQLVVSMRPFRAADAIRAIQISSRFPSAHGAPVHLGTPQAIGIEDLAHPEFGDAPEIEEDELPVFWACGVTPQLALLNANLSLAITHSPGCMLITDLLIEQLGLL
jgi:uncharacterized protein YcsI (UPF0317 family)